jgi:hypothetical protein
VAGNLGFVDTGDPLDPVIAATAWHYEAERVAVTRREWLAADVRRQNRCLDVGDRQDNPMPCHRETCNPRRLGRDARAAQHVRDTDT